MLRKMLLLSLTFILSACSSTVEGGRLLADTELAMLSRFNSDQLYASIQELTKEPRIAGTESEQLAAVFLTTQLELYGYEVDIQNFTIEVAKNESQNLIVTKKPTNDLPKTSDIIIIGAHYDSVIQSPGASDNASGTAVLLEVARMLKDTPTLLEIRFIFFGSEEKGLAGSESYVNHMTTDEIERTIAMFNLDMVGSADAGPLTMFTVDGMPNSATEIGNKANEDLFGETLTIGSTSQSDHFPFHNAAIDAVLFSYFPLEKAYHSANDTIDKLSEQRLKNIAQIIVMSILELTTPDSM
ncbi:M20/M25/M40 family metallo-hydrolase [Sporosarcina sp. YIM B06819]|uniref:M20/M25/M40 family metallo-hydrolase n=1 Tax=Sporosarcina sp. YIM B06819 TaxID=3081769 RepID=UPI00298CC28B|nr:M20/M25/M40 family metallo-hydrolase [Sporosarcina sp. YIM B06819]